MISDSASMIQWTSLFISWPGLKPLSWISGMEGTRCNNRIKPRSQVDGAQQSDLPEPAQFHFIGLLSLIVVVLLPHTSQQGSYPQPRSPGGKLPYTYGFLDFKCHHNIYVGMAVHKSCDLRHNRNPEWFTIQLLPPPMGRKGNPIIKDLLVSNP